MNRFRVLHVICLIGAIGCVGMSHSPWAMGALGLGLVAGAAQAIAREIEQEAK